MEQCKRVRSVLGPSPSLKDSKTRFLEFFPTSLQSTILKNTDRNAPKSYICGILFVKSHRVQGSLKKRKEKKDCHVASLWLTL